MMRCSFVAELRPTGFCHGRRQSIPHVVVKRQEDRQMVLPIDLRPDRAGDKLDARLVDGLKARSPVSRQYRWETNADRPIMATEMTKKNTEGKRRQSDRSVAAEESS